MDSPIIVLGAPRSGTTILAEILSSHPLLHYVVEPRLTWKFGNDARSDLLEPAHATPRVRAHIAGRLLDQVERAGKQRLLEKTPANSLRPGFVRAVFPDAFIIHITRSGYDAIPSIRNNWLDNARRVRVKERDGRSRVRERLAELSWSRRPRYTIEIARRGAPAWTSRLIGMPTWGPTWPGVRHMVAELDLLDVACVQWRLCVERSNSFGATAERFLEVKLEQLDEEMLRQILAVTGLEDGGDGVVDRFKREFDPGRVRASSRLPADEREHVREWIAPTMRWLGYDE